LENTVPDDPIEERLREVIIGETCVGERRPEHDTFLRARERLHRSACLPGAEEVALCRLVMAVGGAGVRDELTTNGNHVGLVGRVAQHSDTMAAFNQLPRQCQRGR
jgi:hypothetical protein